MKFVRKFSSAVSIEFPKSITKKNIILLGAPGAGKGTYSKRLAPILNIPHIAAGDLVRDEIKRGTVIGKTIKDLTEAGQLVPDQTITGLIGDHLMKASNGYLLDGFPRTLTQAETLQSLAPVDLVVNIDLPDEVIMAKILGRRVCSGCGNNYNVAAFHENGLDMPPLLPKIKQGYCDECGGVLEQRKDDTEEIVKNRLNVYNESTAPLIDYYANLGLLTTFSVQKGVKDMPRLVQHLIDNLENSDSISASTNSHTA
jgi:adenylate kinase